MTTANDLLELIKQRYAGDAHIVLTEVADGTGWTQSRWIDAAVFGLWPSKGLTRSAFEIKVSRSDFFHELQNAQKRKWCEECFHEFWFVAPDDVIQLSELPDGAGWLHPHGDKLSIKRHARYNKTPRLDDALLASFMRSAWKSIENNKKTSEKSILAQSKEYQQATIYQTAIGKFLQTKGIYATHETEGAVLTDLNKATADKEVQEHLNQILTITERFEGEILGLFQFFAVIAGKTLLAKNELGKFILGHYGNYDVEAMRLLKEDTLKRPDYQKRVSELVDLIMAWGKLK